MDMCEAVSVQLTLLVLFGVDSRESYSCIHFALNLCAGSIEPTNACILQNSATRHSRVLTSFISLIG